MKRRTATNLYFYGVWILFSGVLLVTGIYWFFIVQVALQLGALAGVMLWDSKRLED